MTRVGRLALPPALRAVVTTLLDTLTALTPTIAAATLALTVTADADPIVARLQTVPGVGPIVALTYRATLDRVDRFPSAGHVSSALGLVPSEDSSGERCRRGHITKVGSSEARAMLIQAAWTYWRSRTVRTAPLPKTLYAPRGSADLAPLLVKGPARLGERRFFRNVLDAE